MDELRSAINKKSDPRLFEKEAQPVIETNEDKW